MILVACGGNGTFSPTSGTRSGAPTIAISVTPTSVNAVLGQSVQFTATVTGTSNHAVTWSFVGDSEGATLSSTGLFSTAEQDTILPKKRKTAREGVVTYTVEATSVADPMKSATATVNVSSGQVVSISVSPTSVTLATGQSTQFTATVTGTSNTAVDWSLLDTEFGGSISSSGLFTAPSRITGQAPTIRIQAKSVADPSKTAIARALILYQGDF